MSQEHPKPEHSGSHTTLLIAFGVCALLAAGIGFWRLPGPNTISAASFEFKALHIDARKLQAQRDEKFKSVQLDQVAEDWARFIQTARVLNQFDFTSPDPADEAATLEKLGYYSNEIIPATGYEGFVAATLPLRDACAQGLDTLRKALGAGKIDLQLALNDPPPAQFAQYRDNCGNQLTMLIERGLISEAGAWTSEDAPLIADILARYRWAHLLKDQYSPWLLLTPYEVELFARWRIEQAAGYSPEKRRAFLAEVGELLPDYNVDFALGVLAYQENDIAGALQHFEKLAKNYPDAGYQGYIRFLEEQRPPG